LARSLYRAIYAGAEEHVVTAMRREDEQAPLADDAFFQRFGGLD
jgi:phenylacetic acid degradation operon negative regulatory protein